jgi:hypothetical protein
MAFMVKSFFLGLLNVFIPLQRFSALTIEIIISDRSSTKTGLIDGLASVGMKAKSVTIG